MRILAVDPGTTQSAVVYWNGTLGEHGIADNGSLLENFCKFSGGQDVMVIEKTESFGMPVGREVFETVFWSGRFAQAWAFLGGRFERVSRRDVKLHICGHARATDANIRQALIDRIGPIGTKKNQGPLYGLKGHEFAALAVAVTYYDLHSGDIRPGVAAQF